MRQGVWRGREGSIDGVAPLPLMGVADAEGLGWEFYSGRGNPRSSSRPLQGPSRAAPRAEGYPITQVLTMVREPVSNVTDSTLMVKKLQEVKAGRTVTGRYQSDWRQVSAHIGKLDSVHWVKAHINDAEARWRAEAGGYPALSHDRDVGADCMVTGGSGLRTAPGQCIRIKYRKCDSAGGNFWPSARSPVAFLSVADGHALPPDESQWDRSASREGSVPMTHGAGSTGS